ncbi:MAG: VanZ family protein [Acidobacteria bacterium]|nr:VanZ family protein [Acidobacteriota bacterium]MCI0721832.1 VanZ family protein [Acidobacteriota bacterium]
MPFILKYWLPPLLWAGLVSVFSTDSFSSGQTTSFILPFFQWLLPRATPEVLNSIHFLMRKLGHWTEFFVLAMLLYRAFRQGQTPQWQLRLAVWTLSLVLLYSVADEIHQRFVPSRSGVWSDSLLDFFGGFCAIALLYARHRSKPDALARVSSACDVSGVPRA